MQLLSLLSKSHDQSRRMGWWSDFPAEANDPARKWYITTKLCLIHSEIDEATGLGKDDHLPHRSAFEVELADAVIRALDLIGFMLDFNTDLLSATAVVPSTISVECLLMDLHGHVSAGMEHFRKGRTTSMCAELVKMIVTVEAAQEAFHINVYDAMIDKLAYNAKRSDHQLVNRQAAGGKSF